MTKLQMFPSQNSWLSSEQAALSLQVDGFPAYRILSCPPFAPPVQLHNLGSCLCKPSLPPLRRPPLHCQLVEQVDFRWSCVRVAMPRVHWVG